MLKGKSAVVAAGITGAALPVDGGWLTK